MSADGQDPARLIDAMLDAYFREHYEIVVCTRQGRDESYYRILTSKLFYLDHEETYVSSDANWRVRLCLNESQSNADTVKKP